MGKGGWRFDAGRAGWKVKAEDSHSIDVRDFHRKGLLNSFAGIWQWKNTETGEVLSSIGFRADGDSVHLHYSADDDPVSETISLTHTRCNFGATRPWFRCPRCTSRVAVLYLRHKRFLCRHCHPVAYRSQSQDAIGRSWIRQSKAEARLGEDWRRPKGMHHRTYERLLSIVFDYRNWREAEIERSLVSAFRGRCPLHF
jgi:hypothetical protein